MVILKWGDLMKKWAVPVLAGIVLLAGCEDEQPTPKKQVVDETPKVLSASIKPTTLSEDALEIVEDQMEEDPAGLYDVQLTNNKQSVEFVLHEYTRGKHKKVHTMAYAVGDEPFNLKLYIGFIENERGILYREVGNQDIRLFSLNDTLYESHLEDKMSLTETPKVVRIYGTFDYAAEVPFSIGGKYQNYPADDLQLTQVPKLYVLTAALND